MTWTTEDGWSEQTAKQSLNATGSAPIYAARAFVVFDFTTNADVTGLSYVRAGTTVTVTGFSVDARTLYRVGHTITVNVSTGTMVGGIYVVTGVTDTTVTFTHGTSGAASGNCSFAQFSILRSGNVSSVADGGTGIGFVNATEDWPAYPMVSGSARASIAGRAGTISPRATAAYTQQCVAINCFEQQGSSNVFLDSALATVIIS
jgi:hypothetical protein